MGLSCKPVYARRRRRQRRLSMRQGRAVTDQSLMTPHDSVLSATSRTYVIDI